MRISDWSSDVCSSDLVRFVRMPGLRVLAELQGDALDGALLFSHSREREAQGAFPMRDGVPDATRRLATLSYALYTLRGSDRTSVVSGKSVSVRVDLGGRRIIKKKHITDHSTTH